MKHLMKQTILSFCACLGFASAANAQQSCYKRKELKSPEPYSIEFSEAYDLEAVESNGNWYTQVQAGRAFGCVIFAVSETQGKLKGRYQSVSASRLNSVCEGKQDYVFTQFADKDGKQTFRLQCEYPVYEDQLPQPFAPSFSQASQLDFEKGKKRTTKVFK